MSEDLTRVWWFSLGGGILALAVGVIAVNGLCEPGSLFPEKWRVATLCGDSDTPPVEIFRRISSLVGLPLISGFAVPLAINWKRMSLKTISISALAALAICAVVFLGRALLALPPDQLVETTVRSSRRIAPILLFFWSAAMGLAFVKHILWGTRQ